MGALAFSIGGMFLVCVGWMILAGIYYFFNDKYVDWRYKYDATRLEFEHELRQERWNGWNQWWHKIQDL